MMDKNRLISRALRHVAQLAALLGIIATPAYAQQGFEDLDKLDSLVAITVGANVGEPGGPVAPIDRRLRLQPCLATPKVEGPVFNAAIVSCAQTGWRIRVPLNIATPATSPTSKVTATKTAAADVVIKKGETVELIAGSDAFSVSRLMTADEDGAVGETIHVREDGKSSPVSARVEKAGRVRALTI